MPVGNRIYTKRRLPERELIEAFEQLPCANVADCMGRDCAMNPRIRLISRPKKEQTAGPALTVKCRGGDNLMLHAAMELAQEGDVVVVSNDEDTNRSLIGEIMMTFLKVQKKIAAIVIDGPIRDMGELSQWELPIYCTGSTPGGPFKDGPGEVNTPIACGGVSVNPGDIILCDADGVICIPRCDAKAILPVAQAYHEKDEQKTKAAAGAPGEYKHDWVYKNLEAKGTEIIDGVYGGESN